MKFTRRVFKKGYVYLMQYDELRTYKAIMHLKNTLIDRRILTNPDKRNGIKYWGWMRFREPLPKWDAMEAGLVPIFDDCEKDAR